MILGLCGLLFPEILFKTFERRYEHLDFGATLYYEETSQYEIRYMCQTICHLSPRMHWEKFAQIKY